MMYDIVKAVHIVAVIVWICGLIATVLMLSHGSKQQLANFRRVNLFVLNPAMIIVWAAGITMAVWYHWFASGWLSLKLVFVILLSGLHGFLSGKLRKASEGADVKVRKLSPILLLIITAFTIVIVLLAGAKPF
ncbi:CopD family protein [Oryzifoliimicrobium ureilyticus]|uniref:CopD family protein n=1 Tax=Oryzifoliimicrobium ureilyticus TaxID=3113724 RepID=UPI0030767BDB